MTADRARLLRQWFEAACDLPEAEWASFLQGCDDAALRAEVLDLLARDRVPDLPLDVPAARRDALLALAGDAPLPARIGRYDVVRVIGRGSMGTVYEARGPDGGAPVAVKVLRMGLPSHALLHRFRREAEILARLDHPGIARILESGTTAVGLSTLPFIAMELVAGRPLDVYCDEERLDVRARLQLLARIGEAVEHAHRAGVVHRDLKPANILVDARGQPRLLDFGVARTTWPAGGRASLHTATGQLVGTLQYMSPEQTLGDPSAVDARSDVYALGALAYTLLAGRPPYDVAGCSFDEALRRVRQEDPPRLGAQHPELRGAIEVVVARALEKEREDRYPTAQAFVDDLQAVRAGRRGVARAPSALQLARRFARRNPRAFRVAAAFAALLLLGLLGTTWGWMEAAARQREVSALLERQREDTRAAESARADAESARTQAESSRQATQDALREAQDVAAFVQDMFASVQPAGLGPRALLVDVLLLVAPRADEQAADRPALAADLHGTLGTAFQAVGRFDLALEHYEAAERLTLALVNADPVRLARLKMARAQIHLEQAHSEEAVRLLEEALVQLPAQEAEQRANATRALGRALGQLGDDAKAAARLAGLLDADGHVPGAPPAVDEGVRLDLAQLQAQRGETAAAEATVRSVLQARTERVGPDHVETLEACLELAEVLVPTGRTDEAEGLYLRTVQGLSDLLGPEHPHTLQARGRLAALLAETGREAEALPELERLVAISRRVVGPDHPSTTSLLYSLSVAAYHAGRAEAPALMDEALASGRAALGHDNPLLVNLLSNVAASRISAGRADESIELLQQALVLCERGGGASLGERTVLELNLASALLSLQCYDELRPLLADALPRSRAVRGDRDPQTITLITYMADVCSHDRAWAQARELYEEVLAADPPPSEPVLLCSRGGLGVALLELGETAQAEPLLRATLAQAEPTFGADSDLAVECREALARLPAGAP